MIETYFHRNIKGMENLGDFVTGENEIYNRKMRFFVSVPDLNFSAIKQNYLLKLERAFNENGHKTKRLNNGDIFVIGLTSLPIWMVIGNNVSLEEALSGRIPVELLEGSRKKDKKTWYGGTKRVSCFRRIPSILIGGGFGTDIDDPGHLQPYLDIISKQNYEYKIETAVNRLKRRISDLKIRPEKRLLYNSPFLDGP